MFPQGKTSDTLPVTSMILSQVGATIFVKRPWDTDKKLWKSKVLSVIVPMHLSRIPSPLEQWCFARETLSVIGHGKFFSYRIYFFQKRVRMRLTVKCKIRSAMCPKTFGGYFTFIHRRVLNCQWLLSFFILSYIQIHGFSGFVQNLDKLKR